MSRARSVGELFNPTEHVEACQFMMQVRVHVGLYPDLRKLFAVPNGGDRHPAVAQKLKAEGVRKGPSDYLLLVPRGTFHGLALELKRLKGGGLEPEQRDFLLDADRDGYCARWARGHAEAWDVLLDYLKLDSPSGRAVRGRLP